MSPTPPGHWVSIMLDIFDRDATPVDRCAEVLAMLGMAISDGFIQCWRSKYEHDLLRPVTKVKLSTWQSLISPLALDLV